jgi:hypothetical protein
MAARQWTVAEDRWLMAHFATSTSREMEVHLHVSRETIRGRLDVLGVQRPHKGGGGNVERRPRQLLSDAQIAKLYSGLRYNQGPSAVVIVLNGGSAMPASALPVTSTCEPAVISTSPDVRRGGFVRRLIAKRAARRRHHSAASVKRTKFVSF